MCTLKSSNRKCLLADGPDSFSFSLCTPCCMLLDKYSITQWWRSPYLVYSQSTDKSWSKWSRVMGWLHLGWHIHLFIILDLYSHHNGWIRRLRWWERNRMDIYNCPWVFRTCFRRHSDRSTYSSCVAWNELSRNAIKQDVWTRSLGNEITKSSRFNWLLLPFAISLQQSKLNCRKGILARSQSNSGRGRSFL